MTGVQGLVVPVPPSANRWWRSVNGRMLKSREARDYQAYVNRLALALGIRPIRRPLQVAVSLVWHRDRKAGDLDKRVGVLLDALEGVGFENDSQICELVAKRVDGATRPRMEVTLYAVTPATDAVA